MDKKQDNIPLLKEKIRELPWYVTFYYVSLMMLLASVPLSKFTTSIFQFFVAGSWLTISVLSYPGKPASESFFKNSLSFLKNVFPALIKNFRSFFSNTNAWLIASIFLIQVVGMLWTTDTGSGIYKLRTQLPILILPILLSTGPKVGEKYLSLLFIGYLLAVFGGSIYRLVLFLNLDVADPRAIDAHTSHIRYSLNVVMAVFSAAYLIFKEKHFLTGVHKILLTLISVWLILFILYMHYSTGILMLVIVLAAVALRSIILNSSKKIKIISLSISLLIISILTYLVLNIVHKDTYAGRVYYYKLDRTTANGNQYLHDTIHFQVENGKHTGLYICDAELRKEWSKRSSLQYSGKDHKNQPLRMTLIRYLASKDLRKDSAGMSKLSEMDIKNIENGLVNSKNIRGFDLNGEITQIVIGFRNYKKTGNANNNSLLQRYEFWKTGFAIFKEHPLFGVGTGDVKTAFDDRYIKDNSKLSPENRLRSHNQYITFMVALGIAGLLWFLVAVTLPAIRQKKFFNYFFFIFWVIFMVSCFTEDTLDSQEGATFFAFFISLFLLGSENKKGVNSDTVVPNS